MARLNTTNPLSTQRPPQKADLPRRTTPSHSISMSSEKKIGAPLAKDPTRKQKKESGFHFNVFADDDQSLTCGDLEEDLSSLSISPTKQKKIRTLKTAKANSLLLPMQHRPRQRPNIKVETDDYEKENDLSEYGTDSYSRGGSPVPHRSPIRRNTTRTPAISRTPSVPSREPSPASEEEDAGDSSFNSLDDFVVSDDDEVSCHETSDSEPEVEPEVQPKSISPPPPPSTRKRLMRGRRPNSYNEGTHKESSPLAEATLPSYLKVSPSPDQQIQEDLRLSTTLEDLSIQDLHKTCPTCPDDETRGDSPVIDLASTPSTPQTPKKTPPRNRSLTSSTKKNRIPPTPHRESTEAFWNQTVTNDWVDVHSPQKPKHKNPESTMIELLQDFDDSEDDSSLKSKDSTSREVSPTPENESLGEANTTKSNKTSTKKAEAEGRKAETAQRKAEKARLEAFDAVKDDLANKFIRELDTIVNGGKILEMTAPTGGLEIRWSKYLQTTAGRASYKPSYARLSSGQMDRSHVARHTAFIELGSRIIQDEDRLVNTLAHEYCHLANYMITGMLNNPHGADFKKWGKTVEDAMADHPKYGGKITVKTTHSYKIAFKYEWKCEGCGHIFGRHSKSIDPTMKVCRCRGRLQQIKPKPRNVSPKKKVAQPGSVPLPQMERVVIDLEQMVL
ncbi:hypothetical protein N7478_006388 [Penicillium angulare]|uniref:uncharacterized protein n=1 Tax=Penicillium angulare TaxID=116970 RepID=UPI00254261C6|nr:uncharacterized protein N7478_006388 [Penicillium angulare]KAJ5281016.1 hypothetical protein N7478_006388 [Penicillium angulare]